MSDQLPPASLIHPTSESEPEISGTNVLSEEPTSQPDPVPSAGQQIPLAFRAVRGGLWLLGSSYWSLIFGFVANIFLMRLLTPATYGEYALAMFFFTLFQLRGKLGLNFAFAQHRNLNGESIGTYFVLDVLLGFGGLLLMVAVAPILLGFGYAAIVVTTAVILALLAFMESFLAVFGVVLDVELRFKPGSIISSVAAPLSYVPAFWLAWQGYGQYSLVAQSIAFSLLSQLIGGLYIAYALRPLFRLRWRFQRDLALKYLRFGVTTGVGSFVAGLVTQADNFILGTLSGVTMLGYYDRAYRIAQWPNLLLNTVIARAAVFTYSQLRDDAEKLRRSSTMILWISANVAIPVALALFLSAPDLVPLLFGAQWTPAVPILRILLITAVVRPLWENLGALFIGMGQPRRIIEVSAIQLVLLIAVGAPLAYVGDAVGMAVGVVLALIVGLVIAYILLRRLLRLDLWDIFGGPVVAAGLTLAIYWVLVRLVGSGYPLWLSALWKIAFALLGFGFFSALVQPRNFSARLTYIWRLLRSRTA